MAIRSCLSLQYGDGFLNSLNAARASLVVPLAPRALTHADWKLHRYWKSTDEGEICHNNVSGHLATDAYPDDF